MMYMYTCMYVHVNCKLLMHVNSHTCTGKIKAYQKVQQVNTTRWLYLRILGTWWSSVHMHVVVYEIATKMKLIFFGSVFKNRQDIVITHIQLHAYINMVDAAQLVNSSKMYQVQSSFPFSHSSRVRSYKYILYVPPKLLSFLYLHSPGLMVVEVQSGRRFQSAVNGPRSCPHPAGNSTKRSCLGRGDGILDGLVSFVVTPFLPALPHLIIAKVIMFNAAQ